MILETLLASLEYLLLSPTLLLGSLWVLGLFMGSFFLVVVDRSVALYQDSVNNELDDNSGTSAGLFGQFLPLRHAQSPPFLSSSPSWVSGRSRCDHCGHQLRWYHNIPVISYLWLGGKCFDCHQPIGRRYPLTELTTGLVFLLAGYLFLHNPLQLPVSIGVRMMFYLILVSVGWLIWLFDGRFMVIPDKLVGLVGLLAVGRCLGMIMSEQEWFCWLEVVMALGLAFLFWLCREIPFWLTGHEGMGWGDIKLVAPLAVLLGYPLALVAVFCAFIIGGVWGIILLSTKQAKLQQRVVFGPFLILGSWIALVWGNSWWAWYWGLLS